MQWIQRSAYHRTSTCGRFSINRAGPVGPGAGADSAGFLAWAVSLVADAGYYPWGVIGCYPTIPEAEKACERHAKEVFRDRA